MPHVGHRDLALVIKTIPSFNRIKLQIQCSRRPLIWTNIFFLLMKVQGERQVAEENKRRGRNGTENQRRGV